MNIKHILLSATTLLCSTNAYSMELQHVTHTNDQDTLFSTPEDIWLYTIAHYQIKDDIRKTCTYFRKLASSTNTALLTHPSLVLSEKALEQFLLYHAAMGDTAIVRHLLAIGADPNTCDDKQMTAMHYAAQYGHVDIVDELLKHPALISTDIANGETSPLLIAIKRDHNLVVKSIFSVCNPHGADTLLYAVKQEALNSVRTLLACKIDPNAPVNDYGHPLISAALKGNTHTIKLLITKGANIACRSKHENTFNAVPLHFTASHGHTSATQLLIDYGANVNIKGTDINTTPLHCASSNGHIGIVKILLKNDAYINEKDNQGDTPLDDAENDEIKQLLIAHGGKTGAELKQLELKQNQPEKENNNCVVQ